ncbi:DUF871 domain-containing protein [Lachnospiraceae bacterium oral taxon 500]|nr:DUF871 domain-containing protein [Lachnospiraceae bacterium oral taxon 500]
MSPNQLYWRVLRDIFLFAEQRKYDIKKRFIKYGRVGSRKFFNRKNRLEKSLYRKGDQMYKPLNFSAFLSNFEELKPFFPEAEEYKKIGGTPYIFTSLHIAEENTADYAGRIKEMCAQIRAMGYQLIADVSKKTLEYVKKDDIVEVAREYGISILRPDFGFSREELAQIAAQIPICVNATILKEDEIEAIRGAGGEVYAMHNYYPRPETGLDDVFFRQRNDWLKAKGIPVMAFIAGNVFKRGPIFEGLPTLEQHRGLPPYVAYLDLALNFGIEDIYVGDGAISREEWEKIEYFRQTGELYLPVQTLSDKYDEYLFGRSYTVRVDSPRWVKRLQESREFAAAGREIEPVMALPRKAGSVTIDNIRYGRYSGEMQIVAEDLPLDERVNVIARISAKYLPLLPLIKNEQKVRFFKEN